MSLGACRQMYGARWLRPSTCDGGTSTEPGHHDPAPCAPVVSDVEDTTVSADAEIVPAYVQAFVPPPCVDDPRLQHALDAISVAAPREGDGAPQSSVPDDGDWRACWRSMTALHHGASDDVSVSVTEQVFVSSRWRRASDFVKPHAKCLAYAPADAVPPSVVALKSLLLLTSR